jgi:hypothetical protein
MGPSIRPAMRAHRRRSAAGCALLLAALLGCRSDAHQGTGPKPITSPPPMAQQTSPAPQHSNRLSQETSPYLLQHQHNPVDWYPWGPEALERARAENRPIFLSVGYSACHWCHVMEAESFEDPAIAKLLNERFIAIKVDREERPDVDELYMKAVTAMTGQGGWPMSVFLTPDGEPFFGGTYFPPTPRHGLPGFQQILAAISQRWAQDPAALRAQGQRLADGLRAEAALRLEGQLAGDVLERSLEERLKNFDRTWGGFGDAPKFPHPMDLRLCLWQWQLSRNPELEALLRLTLDRMAAGGIFDQLAGGFHRYSTDERWLIPHFEKMLTDNALLIPVYLEAAQMLCEPRYAQVALATAQWTLREMTTESGGLASSLDADVAGVEGAHYAWTPEELDRALGREQGRIAAELWDVRPEGNFEHGSSALWRPDPDERVAARLGISATRLGELIPVLQKKLLAERELRPRPGRDDKVIAAWNGLMIGALARIHQQLGNGDCLRAAQRAADFLLNNMFDSGGRLQTTWRLGRAQHMAGLLDHACVIQGLLELFASDFDPRWLSAAERLSAQVEQRFADSERGGYFDTPHDGEVLLARLKTALDGALPSGNAVMAQCLLRLGALTGQEHYRIAAERALCSLAELANRHPEAFSQLLQAELLRRRGLIEVVISGELEDPDTQALLATLRSRCLPQCVVVLADQRTSGPLVAGRQRRPGQPAQAYVCRAGTCQLPVSSPVNLLAELERLTGP